MLAVGQEASIIFNKKTHQFLKVSIYVAHDKYATLRVGVDYGEELHRSRILGERSNMIAYKVGSSPARVYTMAKTSQVENFNHGWKNDLAINMATPFARGVLQRSSFLDNLKPSNKKLGLQTEYTNLRFDFFLIKKMFSHLLHHTNHCLKWPCLGLNFLTNQWNASSVT